MLTSPARPLLTPAFRAPTRPEVTQLSPVQQMGQEIILFAMRGMQGTPEQVFFFVKTCLADPSMHLKPLYIRETTSHADFQTLRNYQYRALCYMQTALRELGETSPASQETCTTLIANISTLIATQYADCLPSVQDIRYSSPI